MTREEATAAVAHQCPVRVRYPSDALGGGPCLVWARARGLLEDEDVLVVEVCGGIEDVPLDAVTAWQRPEPGAAR